MATRKFAISIYRQRNVFRPLPVPDVFKRVIGVVEDSDLSRGVLSLSRSCPYISKDHSVLIVRISSTDHSHVTFLGLLDP